MGSLDGSKLADLFVLDANPLENIRNTNTLRYVMKKWPVVRCHQSAKTRLTAPATLRTSSFA